MLALAERWNSLEVAGGGRPEVAGGSRSRSTRGPPSMMGSEVSCIDVPNHIACI